MPDQLMTGGMSKREFDAARKERQFRITELYIWNIVSIIVLGRVFIALYLYPGQTREVILDYYVELALGFFILIFPTLYRLVFGNLPLQALRQKRIAGRPEPDLQADSESLNSGATPDSSTGLAVEKVAVPGSSQEVGRGDLVSTLDAHRLLFMLAQSSKSIADGLYSRSGVYLLVGVLVAFSGLGFFAFFNTQATVTLKADLPTLLLSLAPRFGVLVFIELIAFFFLRQYRTSMDEYRYYEAIKRHREETMVLMRLGTEQSKPIDPLELVKLGQFFSMAGRLQKEETTELLEARKLEKNETAVLEKVIEAISHVRK